MIECIICKKKKVKNYFLKKENICKTCLRKETAYNKSCNKCKKVKPVNIYTMDKRICDICINRIINEEKEGKKLCSKCGKEKNIERFSKGYVCFDCQNKDRKIRIKNGLSKRYPNSKIKTKEWREKNKDKIKIYRRNYSKIKYKNDINYKLAIICRTFLNRCFHGKNGNRTFEILGYSSEKLKQRLECQFTSEMNWENYGKVWNIDHRKPIKMFNKEAPIYIINALSNLKPIIKEENFSKQNRFIS